LRSFLTQSFPWTRFSVLVRFPPVELPFGSDTIIRNLIANGDTITVDVKTDAELEIAAQNEKNFRIRDNWIAETQKGVTAPDFTKVEVVVRKIADDNSCLFNAVGYLLENRSRTSGARIRREVANFIEKNPDLYSDAVLGRKAAEYVQWISNPNSCSYFSIVLGPETPISETAFRWNDI
jgi:ubiquitin thioesterase OTU1